MKFSNAAMIALISLSCSYCFAGISNIIGFDGFITTINLREIHVRSLRGNVFIVPRNWHLGKRLKSGDFVELSGPKDQIRMGRKISVLRNGK